jgi:hypothetical protein
MDRNLRQDSRMEATRDNMAIIKETAKTMAERKETIGKIRELLSTDH